MSELLVVLTPDLHPAAVVNAPVLNAKRIQRGEIITVQEDGHQWGTVELARPDWIVIKVPDMPVHHGRGYCGPQPGDHNVNPALRARASAINLDHPIIQSRMAKIITLSYSDLRSLIVIHPTPPIPNLVSP